MDYSFLTEFIILATWGLTPWYSFYLFKSSGHSLLKSVSVSLLVLAWSFWGWGIVRYDFDSWFTFPGRPLVYLAAICLMTWIFRKSIIGKGLNQHLLVGLQLCRPIGMVFVLEYFRGNLPGIFAHPAGWGDLTAGIVALVTLIKFWNKEIPSSWIKLVFWVGICDFISAFFFGFTSSDHQFQLFAFDHPNQATLYPLGIIPLYLVPFAAVCHLLSMAELERKESL